jgi:hypothetical protein
MSNPFCLTMSAKENRAAASLRGDSLHSAPDCHLRTDGYNLVGNARETIICASFTGHSKGQAPPRGDKT